AARMLKFAQDFWTQNLHVWVNALVLGLFYLPRVIKLVREDKLYFGGTTGFIPDTVASLVHTTFYDIPHSATTSLLAACLVASISGAVALTTLIARTRAPLWRIAATLSLLLVLTTLVLMLQFQLFHVRFIVERAALMFVPLFVAQQIFFAAGMPQPALRL